MKYLLKINGPDTNSRNAANLMETPLSLKIAIPGGRQKTVSMADILKFGSADKIGLEGLFAHKLRDYNKSGCSVDRVKAIQDGNLGKALNTKANIIRIRSLLPSNTDSYRLLNFAFTNSDGESIATGSVTDPNDFSFFYRDNFLEASKVTEGMIVVAGIYKLLQEIHKITPEDRLKKRIEFVLKTNS